MDEQRSRETRARAETALVRLLHALGDEDVFLEVRERYVGTTDSGPVGYAEQALQVQPEAGEIELRADAVDVVQRFFAEIDA